MKSLAGARAGSVWWKPGLSSHSPAEAPCTQGNGSIRPSHVSWTLGGQGGGVRQVSPEQVLWSPQSLLLTPPLCV